MHTRAHKALRAKLCVMVRAVPPAEGSEARCPTPPASQTRTSGRHQPPPGPPAASRPSPGPAAPPRATRGSGEVMAAAVVIVAIATLTGLGVLTLLVLVLVAIHDEDRHMSLTSTPRTRTEAVTRRLLGVGIRTHGTSQPPPGSDKP